MRITVQEAIDRARILLQEVLFAGEMDGTAWTNAELLMWANDAVGEVARLTPTAYSDNIILPLEAGALQHLPSNIAVLIEAVCNVDTQGNDGRAVTKTVRRMIDGEDPDWRSKPQAPTVRRYMPSASEPRSFEVYPPNDGTGKLRVVCTPEYCPVGADEQLPISSIFLSAVVNYICYRAFGREQENADATSKSGEFYQAFVGAINGTAENNTPLTGAVGP